MKKYLLVLILIFISIVSYSQKRGSLFTVPNSSTVFMTSLPAGTLILQMDSAFLFYLDSFVSATDNILSSDISTIVKSGTVENADSLGHQEPAYYRDTVRIDFCCGCAMIDGYVGMNDTIFIDTCYVNQIIRDTSSAYRVILNAYINDSSDILHWNDTTTNIATKYDVDTAAPDTINYIGTLYNEDTLTASIYVLISALFDTTGIHLDTNQSHNTRINNLVDSIAIHLDSIDSLRSYIGTRLYTEENYVTDGESVTSSIDTLDKQVKNNTDAIVGEDIMSNVFDSLSMDSAIIYKYVLPDIDYGASIGSYNRRFDSAFIQTINGQEIIFGDGTTIISYQVDSSIRVVAAREDGTDTIFYGIKAMDLAQFYVRYTDTNIYNLYVYGDTLDPDSNLALPHCTWIFHNNYIKSDKTGFLFDYQSGTDYIKILGYWSATVVNGVIDITDIGESYIDYYVEHLGGDLIATGAVNVIDANTATITRLNSFVHKGRLCYSLLSDAIGVRLSEVTKNFDLQCNTKSDAGNGLFFYTITACSTMYYKADYAIGSVNGLAFGWTGAAAAVNNHSNKLEVGFCNTPIICVSGTNAYTSYTGKINLGCSLYAIQGNIDVYGDIYYGSISVTGSDTYKQNLITIHSSIRGSTYTASNANINVVFKKGINIDAPATSTFYSTNTFFYEGVDKANGGGNNFYNIAAGTHKFMPTYKAENTYSTTKSYIYTTGGITEFNGYMNYNSTTQEYSNMYINGGTTYINPSAKIINSVTLCDKSLTTKFPSALWVSSGKVVMDGGTLIVTNDTASGITFYNYNDTLTIKSDYYTNKQYSCVTNVLGIVNLSAGHDWNAVNDSFAISINGATTDTIVLNADCNTLAEVITHINTQLVAEGVTEYIVYSTDNYVNIMAKKDGGNATLILAAGGGTALTTLGLTAATTESKVTIVGYGSERVSEYFTY